MINIAQIINKYIGTRLTHLV
ncbi:unnamed protein product [Timema podura]|uniref:Uncharacterized protein n=1 Tax=Timema podura TaxID=61482 RepID=A0ABN7PIJ6_TIMPD|nr:unnamed protein product [Timema podura]